MKRVLLIIFILCTVVLTAQPVRAQITPHVECDVCGYCYGQEAPANWKACAQCRYPGVVDSSTEAIHNKTLNIVDTVLQKAAQPAGGKYYTQLGCLDTGLTSFRNDSGAVGATINFILSKLLFPIAGTLAFGGIIFGAFLLLTAQGEQEKILRGKKLVTSSIVGVIFTFSSIFIINFIAGDVLKIPGFAKGTKVTFVGYGTATTEKGAQIYPNITVFYDGKEVGKIDALKGAVDSPETRIVYLPKAIDLTGDVDIKKVRFVFTNDKCYTPHQNSSRTGSCCYFRDDKTTRQPPHTNPLCNDPTYNGDRNIYSYNILFDDKQCQSRQVWIDNNPPTDDSMDPDQIPQMPSNNLQSNWLHNYWGSAYYTCAAL